MYSATVMEHFQNPRNCGELPDADGVGRAGPPDDSPVIVFAVRREGQSIARACFQTFGCGAAIAAGSVLTELVIGRTMEQCLDITPQTLDDALGGLPGHKLHCAEIAVEALHLAVADAGRS
jgi:nitrogen fixation protein NifU and related proteins